MTIYLVSEGDANAAYRAGVIAQEHGAINDFYPAHDELLASLGYTYCGAPCECPEVDECGHLPTCGWGMPEAEETQIGGAA